MSLLNAAETVTVGDASHHIEVTKPFKLQKVASKLVSLCKEHSHTGPFGKQYIKFVGSDGDKVISETFDVKSIINAFQAVGQTAVGEIVTNDSVCNGKVLISVTSADTFAIVMPIEGGCV